MSLPPMACHPCGFVLHERRTRDYCCVRCQNTVGKEHDLTCIRIEPGGHRIFKPEQCPQPEFHETFHYCPLCSWTSDDAPRTVTLPRSDIEGVLEALKQSRDGWWVGEGALPSEIAPVDAAIARLEAALARRQPHVRSRRSGGRA